MSLAFESLTELPRGDLVRDIEGNARPVHAINVASVACTKGSGDRIQTESFAARDRHSCVKAKFSRSGTAQARMTRHLEVDRSCNFRGHTPYPKGG